MYHFETVKVEPIRIIEKSFIAMSGEYQVLVLYSFNNLFFSLFFKHLLLG